ncbi:hypothetical protein O3P69_010735 [Scylla paramamosain]|uniref:Sulfatase N-terminal domain-containing protein n=1 Tax=Scylla paramamosain TaxID=85552 RepID=A0AAW0TEU3_SCYPA
MREAAWWCLLLWAVCGDARQTTHQPNIVFIISDDQGFADVSWHDKEVVTPNLQKLLDGGVKLNYNYVQPLCTPTRSALMTGYYPYHLGRQKGVITPTTPTGLTLSRTLLPEKLRDLGLQNSCHRQTRVKPQLEDVLHEQAALKFQITAILQRNGSDGMPNSNQCTYSDVTRVAVLPHRDPDPAPPAEEHHNAVRRPTSLRHGDPQRVRDAFFRSLEGFVP